MEANQYNNPTFDYSGYAVDEMGVPLTTKDAALAYLAAGWTVSPTLPMEPDPVTGKLVKRPDYNPNAKPGKRRLDWIPGKIYRKDIELYFSSQKNRANGLAVHVGAGTGVCVVDVDTEAGGHKHDGMRSMLEAGISPDAWRSRVMKKTPSGGEHWLYKLPDTDAESVRDLEWKGGADYNVEMCGQRVKLYGVDLLCIPHLLTVYPTIRDGKVYPWCGELMNGPEGLPDLPRILYPAKDPRPRPVHVETTTQQRGGLFDRVKGAVRIREYLADRFGGGFEGDRIPAIWRGGNGNNVAITERDGRESWRDFVTNEGGSVVDLCMVCEGIENPLEAAKVLASRYGIQSEQKEAEHTKTAEPGALLGMVHTWGEISQKVYPPQRWLIEKVVPESTPEDGRTARGLKGDLVAKSKVGKTWLALRIACCVAGGAPYAPGMDPKPPRPVLYVNMELPGNQVQYRVRVIAQALGCDGDELARNLTILTPPPGSAGMFRTEYGATAEFLELCTRYALVVLDPLYKFVLPEEDENAAVDMAKVAAWRDELLDGGATVLVVHHEIKGKGEGRDITDAGAGSGVLGRDYDFKIWATADETGHRKISYSSRLDRERPEDYAMFNAERGGFEFTEGIARDAVAANFGKGGKSSLTADQRRAVKAVQDGYHRWTDPHAKRTGESLLEAFGMFAEPAPEAGGSADIDAKRAARLDALARAGKGVR